LDDKKEAQAEGGRLIYWVKVSINHTEQEDDTKPPNRTESNAKGNNTSGWVSDVKLYWNKERTIKQNHKLNVKPTTWNHHERHNWNYQNYNIVWNNDSGKEQSEEVLNIKLRRNINTGIQTSIARRLHRLVTAQRAAAVWRSIDQQHAFMFEILSHNAQNIKRQ